MTLHDAYASAFRVLGRYAEEGHSVRRAKFALVLALTIRVRELRELHRGQALRELAAATTWTEIRRILAFRRAEVRERWASSALRDARLTRYAGVPGTDWDGRPFDERGFAEANTAMDQIALFHRARRKAGRYDVGLLDGIAPLLRDTVPAASIAMHLGRHRRSWWASTKTPGGWWIGCGATGAQAEEWT
jgi:hypothetical protein